MRLIPWWRGLVVVAMMTALGGGLLATPGWAGDDETEQAAAEKSDAAKAEASLVNSLKWTTASEVDNFGFDIYRGTSEDGPFERMTAEPLAGAGTVDEPQHYVWVDDTIDPEQDYWYYIESITIDNVRERFSPVIKAPAKRPKAAATTDEEHGDAE